MSVPSTAFSNGGRLPRQTGANGSAGLHRCLTLVDVIFFGVGKMVGAGILVLLGAAARSAGPAVVISYQLTALAVLCTALCYAEFVSQVPLAGGAYSFVGASLGEMPAFFTGWLLLFEYACGAAALSRGWTGYLADLLGHFGVPPQAWATPYGTDSLGFRPNIAAFVLCGVLAVIVAAGVGQASAINKVVTCIKLGCVVLIVVMATLHANSDNMPQNIESLAPNGISGIVQASVLVFYSYIGFDAVASIAEEVVEPEKTMPRGILCCIAVAAGIYSLVCISMTLMVPAGKFDSDAPIAVAFESIGCSWMAVTVSLAAVVGLPSGIMLNLTSQARTLMALARDGLFPPEVAWVHPRTQTPLLATAIASFLALPLSAFVPFEMLSVLMSCGTLLALMCVNVGFICRRYAANEMPAPWEPLFLFVAGLILSFSSVSSFTGEWMAMASVLGACGAATSVGVALHLVLRCPPAAAGSRGFQVPGGATAPLLGTAACGFMLWHAASARILWPICVWFFIGVTTYLSTSGSRKLTCTSETQPIYIPQQPS